MNKIDLNNGTVRAVIAFVLAFFCLRLLFWLLDSTFGISFFADTLVILIGAGWLAYWVWRKTEHGYY